MFLEAVPTQIFHPPTMVSFDHTNGTIHSIAKSWVQSIGKMEKVDTFINSHTRIIIHKWRKKYTQLVAYPIFVSTVTIFVYSPTNEMMLILYDLMVDFSTLHHSFVLVSILK